MKWNIPTHRNRIEPSYAANNRELPCLPEAQSEWKQPHPKSKWDSLLDIVKCFSSETEHILLLKRWVEETNVLVIFENFRNFMYLQKESI